MYHAIKQKEWIDLFVPLSSFMDVTVEEALAGIIEYYTTTLRKKQDNNFASPTKHILLQGKLPSGFASEKGCYY